MSKFNFVVMIFCLFFCRLQADVDPAMLDHFHVCTTSSKPHPNLDKLIESCQIHNIDLQVLGMGLPYPGNGTKFLRFLDYIEPLPDDDIAMLIDAFDILIIADKDKILEKFLSLEVPILISAEVYCGPKPKYARQYPPSPTRFKYLCAGAFMGYVGNIKAWAKTLQPVNPGTSDQLQITLKYIEGKKKLIFLDHHCDVFLSLYRLSQGDVEIDSVNRLVRVPETGGEPCVIHANGRYFHTWDQVYEQLIQPES